MKHRLAVTALLLLPAALAGVAEAGPLKLGRRHKDESNGFQIQPPYKWEQVPTKYNEVSLVGKWGAPRAKRGHMAAGMWVLRFIEEVESDEPETPRDSLGRGIPGYREAMQFQEKDVWDYVRKNFGWRPLQVVEDEPEFKMSRKELTAHVKVFEQPAGARAADEKSRVLICAAQIRTVEPSDSSYGLVFGCTIADKKDMLRTFERIISRFRVLDPDDDDDPDDEDAVSDDDIFVDSTKKPEAWRAARKKKLIKGWKAIDTRNYLIVYNDEVKRNLIRKVAKHIEAIRAQVYEQLFPPAQNITAISVVRVCKDKAEYHRYGGPGGSAGYWSRGDEELVFYQDKSNKKDSLRVLYHEAFHQYIHYAVGDVAPHSWFNEGHGDYFAGHDYVSRKFKAKPFRWRTGTISNALAQGNHVPLDEFLKYTQAQYYANPGLCYAQGWSFVYFLREVERRKIKKYKKYWGVLDKYFAAIKRNVAHVKEKGLYGLEDPPAEPPDLGERPGTGDGDATGPAAPPGLPRLPGLELPFPGENPLAGAGEAPRGASKTVAGPKITGVRSGLDAAIDEAFKGIDLAELEKDWIEFSK